MPYRKNPTTNQIIELDVFGEEFSEWTIPTDAELLQEAKTSKIPQCKSYLSSTDWYVIRKADNGTAIPTQIETNRELARTLQDNINACTTIEELNLINIEF